jgi:hypothetical protein
MGADQAMLLRLGLFTIAIACWIGFTAYAIAETFPTECPFPKAASGKLRKVDRQCGLRGAPGTDSHRAQNAAKNNFCAQGPIIDLSREHFEQLQSAAERTGVEFGARDRLPEDRSVLRQLLPVSNGARVGEGSLVRHVGFLTNPRNSNVNNGESVNCNFRGAENNDIHFDLVQDPDDDACLSVTGEVTPHRRSAHYEKDVLLQSRIAERPVRVTGQLFFDASHKPCVNGEPHGAPLRISLWEIHPVYSVEVCKRKTIDSCPSNDDTVWLPIERFSNVPHEEEDDDEN